jgi:signal transduction protein with GAF and PtsI domain
VLAFLWSALGVDELSMSPGFIPPVARLLRALAPQDAETLAGKVRERLDDSSARDIYELCRNFILSRLPDRESFEELLGKTGT